MLGRPKRIEPGPGQESVWDYPRPAVAEAVEKHIRVEFGGETLIDAPRAVRVLETSHPPTYYIAPDFVDAGLLSPSRTRSLCEWKGQARYFDLRVGDRVARDALWTYPTPTRTFEILRDHFALYPAQMDACYVDDDGVEPQPGGFYGGWITPDVVGPFKGGPGTMGW